MSDIAFILDNSFTIGGAQRVAAALIEHWVRDGRDVRVITMRKADRDSFAIPAGVQRIVLGGAEPSVNRLVGLIRNVRHILRLRGAIRKTGARVAVSFLLRTNVCTVLASVGLGVRVVISERNDVSRQKHRRPWGWVRRRVYRYANVVTANSSAALESMRRYVPASKLAFVPNPVAIPEELAAPDRSTMVLSVGRLEPHKAQKLIIEAMGIVGESGREWRLDVLGEGEERPNLAACALAHGVADRVHLRGVVHDPSPYYLSAGIFVLPSIYEGTPNALLEAMAHGLPCVVADSLPGALEYIDHGVSGLVFRSGDPADLATKLKDLMNDPALRVRLGTAARARMGAAAEVDPMAVWEEILDLEGPRSVGKKSKAASGSLRYAPNARSH